MNIRTRDEKIYQMSKSGKSHTEIAKMHGICKERVRQICIKLDENKENYDSWPPLKKLLSTRAQNALILCFKDGQILENPENIISSISYNYLRTKMQFVGKKSAEEISQALITLGHLESDDQWFKG